LRTRITRSRAIAFTGIAFIVGIRIDRNVATDAIDPDALFRNGTSLTSAHADVPATNPIHAIVGQTLRRCCAGKTIVVFAHVFPVACPVRTIIVGIRIVFNRPADSIRAAAFFRGAARHAFVVAFAVATKTIHA
jgi:hypothetical protein